jgi:hypothetical protein
MTSSGVLRYVALVRTDVSELSASIIRMMMEALSSFETPAIARATLRIIPEDAFLHSHRRENLKSYIKRLIS